LPPGWNGSRIDFGMKGGVCWRCTLPFEVLTPPFAAWIEISATGHFRFPTIRSELEPATE
jgi:hypothetical protein